MRGFFVFFFAATEDPEARPETTDSFGPRFPGPELGDFASVAVAGVLLTALIKFAGGASEERAPEEEEPDLAEIRVLDISAASEVFASLVGPGLGVTAIDTLVLLAGDPFNSEVEPEGGGEPVLFPFLELARSGGGGPWSFFVGGEGVLCRAPGFLADDPDLFTGLSGPG